MSEWFTFACDRCGTRKVASLPTSKRCSDCGGNHVKIDPRKPDEMTQLRAENERLRKEVEFWRQRAKGAETEREVLHEENGKLAAEARWHKHSCGMAKDKLAKLEEVKDEQT